MGTEKIPLRFRSQEREARGERGEGRGEKKLKN